MSSRELEICTEVNQERKRRMRMMGFKLVEIETEVSVCQSHCTLYNHDKASCPPKAREMCKLADVQKPEVWHYFEEVRDET